jgi:hypothetical protein
MATLSFSAGNSAKAINSNGGMTSNRVSPATQAAEAGTQGGGGMTDGPIYIALLFELSSRTGELEALGVQIKDYARGLIDFPSLRDGNVILLCWQLGEGDQLEWWHDLESGFAGRQPLNSK